MQGVDLGTTASSLSRTIGSLGEALDRISSSTSLQYLPLSRPFFQRTYIAFAGNSDLCFSFLQNCANYGEKVFTWCLPFVASLSPSHAGSPHDLRERITTFLSEATGISVENAAMSQGPRHNSQRL